MLKFSIEIPVATSYDTVIELLSKINAEVIAFGKCFPMQVGDGGTLYDVERKVAAQWHVTQAEDKC